MTLNATLLVQIINFFFAYLLIDRILLRKVVGIIQHDRQEKSTLMKDIELQRDKVAGREQVKADKWGKFRGQFLEKIPLLKEPPTMKKVTIPLKFAISPADIEWYAGQLKNVLIERVGDVSE